MAISTRELILIVRAQNQASQALRRVANDMRSLGRVQNLQAKRAQLAVNERKLIRQRMRAERELQSLQSGTRYLTRQKALLAGGKRGNLLAREHNALMRSLEHELVTVGQSLDIVRAKQAALNAEIRAARWDKFGTFSRMMGHFGRVMQLAGLVGGAALGYAANAAATFNKQVVLVATQTGKVGSGMNRILQNSKQLEKGLLAVASTGISTFDEVTDAAYDLFSTFDQLGDSSQGINQGIGIMKLFSKASIAGMTDINTVANGVIASMTAFDEIPKTAAGVNRVLQRMFAAVRFGRMTFAEFAQTLGTAAPAAKAAGQSFDTMAGTIAFLSRPLGVNKAAIGFARLSEIFSRKKFLEGIQKAGISITKANGALLPMPEIIDRLAKKFPELTKGGGAITRFFKKMSGTEGTIQARRAFVFLMQGIDEYRRVLGKTINDNNEFSRSFDAMSKTTGVKWSQFLNQLKTLFIELGNAAIPTLLEILQPIEDLVHWFAKLDDQTKKQIGKVAVWTAALLLVGGTILTVGGAILGFIAIMGKMGIIFKSMSALVIIATVAIAAFKGHWDSLGDAMKGLGDIFLGSWTGFIAGSVLAVAAIRKVAAAITMVKTASFGIATAEAAGGLLPFLMGGGRGGPGRDPLSGRFVKAGGAASRFGTILAEVGLTSTAIGASLSTIVPVVGALGLGALAWKIGSDRAADAAKRAADEWEKLRRIADAPIKTAGAIGQIGGNARDLKRAKLDYKDMVARVKELKQNMKGLTGAEREQAQRDLARAILDKADAWDVLTIAQNKNWQNRGAVMAFFNQEKTAHDQLTEKLKRRQEIQIRLAAIQKKYNAERQTGRVGDLREQQEAQGLRQELDALNDTIVRLQVKSGASLGAFHTNFTKTVKSLQAAEFLPKGGKGVVQNIEDFARMIGKMPSLKQMRAIITVGVKPSLKDLKNLPALIRNFFAKQRLQKAKAQIDVAISKIRVLKGEHGNIPGEISKQLKRAGAKVAANIQIRAQTAGALEKIKTDITGKKRTATVNMKANTDDLYAQYNTFKEWLAAHPPTATLRLNKPNTAPGGGGGGGGKDKQTGRAIADESARRVSEAVKALRARRAALREAFAEPIREAIAEGRQLISDLFSKVDELREIPGKEAKKPLTVSILIRSAKKNVSALVQYYNALERLRKRGTPEALVEQLASLGVDASKYLKMLSKASKSQLKEFIRNWNKAERAIAKAAKSIRNIIRMLTNDMSAGIDGLKGLYQDFLSTVQSIIGDFLSGFDFSWGITAAQILAEVNKGLAKAQQLSAGLAKLKAMGVPFDVIMQFLALGPDALATINAFLAGTPEQQAAIIAGMQATADAASDIAKELLKQQIKEWKKQGAAIAAGIIAGLIDSEPQLRKFFRKLFRDLLKDAQNELKAHSPSMEFFKVGQNLMEGFQLGINSIKPTVGMPSLSGVNPRAMGAGYGGGVSMVVNAHHTETLDTTLARASFRLRNRR